MPKISFYSTYKELKQSKRNVTIIQINIVFIVPIRN